MGQIAFVIPGDLQLQTGGYIYNRHLANSLKGILEVYHVPMPPYSPDLIDKIWKDLSSTNYDQVVIDGLAGAHLGSLVDRLDKRTVYLEHLPQKDRWDAERNTINSCAKLICTSNYTAGWLRQNGVEVPIGVVIPGTDLSGKKTVYSQVAKNLLYIGSGEPRKGLADLVDGLLGITDQEWKLEIAGEFEAGSEHWKEISRKMSSTQLADRFVIYGALDRESVNRLMLSADMLVSPSYDETYGMAVAEAISLGVPVLCRDIPAYRSNFSGLTEIFSTQEEFENKIRIFLTSEDHYLDVVNRSISNKFGAREWKSVAAEFIKELGSNE